MSLPGLAAAGASLVVAVALVETTGLLAGSGETTGLAVLQVETNVSFPILSPQLFLGLEISYLVHRLDDPVDAGIAANGLVLGINKDDLVVLVGRILVNPVGVENAQVGAAAADTLLSGGTERTLVLELVHTMVGGLAYPAENESDTDAPETENAH